MNSPRRDTAQSGDNAVTWERLLRGSRENRSPCHSTMWRVDRMGPQMPDGFLHWSAVPESARVRSWVGGQRSNSTLQLMQWCFPLVPRLEVAEVPVWMVRAVGGWPVSRPPRVCPSALAFYLSGGRGRAGRGRTPAGRDQAGVILNPRVPNSAHTVASLRCAEGRQPLLKRWRVAIFHPRWSGGRVAEGTGLLSASPAFRRFPFLSVSVLQSPCPARAIPVESARNRPCLLSECLRRCEADLSPHFLFPTESVPQRPHRHPAPPLLSDYHHIGPADASEMALRP